MSQAVIDFVVDGYARYNARDRSQPWPPDHELPIWQEDAEYVAAREDPDSAIHRGIRRYARSSPAGTTPIRTGAPRCATPGRTAAGISD